MSLHPTRTRLRLLAEVAAGTVYRYGDGHDYDSGQYKVTARMAEMQRAGWVVLPSSDYPPYKRRWLITPAGKAVLDRREVTS